jgi:uncharacterized membrane protein
MDRSDQYGGLDHDMGRGETHEHGSSDYYRQSFGEHGAFRSDSSVDWGSIGASALMLALGGYLFYQGVRGRSIGLPFAGHGEEGHEMGAGMRRMERSMSSMTGRMSKIQRESPGVKVREQVTVSRSVSDLYRFWRNVENLPRVMTYLEDVSKTGDRRSHWVAKGPAGQLIEWDAEITDARENELVAWRSLEGSEVPNEGSVRFSRSPDGSGTIVDVALTYHPPGGKAGAAVAKLFGREPAQEIRRDLERFKERVESGNLILATGSQGGPYAG